MKNTSLMFYLGCVIHNFFIIYVSLVFENTIYTHTPAPISNIHSVCSCFSHIYRKLLLFFFMHITRIMIFFGISVYKSVFFMCGKFINIVGNGMLRNCDYFYFLSMSQSILVFGICTILMADSC